MNTNQKLHNIIYRQHWQLCAAITAHTHILHTARPYTHTTQACVCMSEHIQTPNNCQLPSLHSIYCAFGWLFVSTGRFMMVLEKVSAHYLCFKQVNLSRRRLALLEISSLLTVFFPHHCRCVLLMLDSSF